MDQTNRRPHFPFPSIFLFALLIGQAAAVSLQGQTLITSLPFFILFPTKYQLSKNLTYEGKVGSAIMVLSSNVDLDLNGCALEDTTPENQSIAILVDHQQNVTIRNGIIRGFKQSIVFDDHNTRITWPDNDLAANRVTIQSVKASADIPQNAEKKPQTEETTEKPKSSPSAASESPAFLDRYDATKSSPEPSNSAYHRRRHRRK